MVKASKTVTINRPREHVYGFWRRLDNLPSFMFHLQSVEVHTERLSHWVVNTPAGTPVEWDAEITDDRPGEFIAWRSREGAVVPNAGSVRFSDAPAGRGTEVRVEVEYAPPGGSAGAKVAAWLGQDPAQQLRDDLRRFKQVMETGEVVLSDGSLAGAGQGASRQRPAQPREEVTS